MKLSWRFSTWLAFLAIATFGFFGCQGKKGNTAKFDPAFGLVLPGSPYITAVKPSEGPDVGGTTVTIEGSGFQGSIKIFFGGSPATNIQVIGSNQVRCTIPPGREGFVDVTAVNVDGSFFILRNGFKYIHYAIKPNFGNINGGYIVVIEGANFVGNVQVWFGGQAATTVNVLGANLLEVTVPASAGGKEEVVDVTISSSIGTIILSKAFAYTGWLFENPDNVANDIRGMAATDDGKVVMAVGMNGMVSIMNTNLTNKDWLHTQLYSDSGLSKINFSVPIPFSSNPLDRKQADFYGVSIATVGSNYVAFIVGEQGFVAYRNRPTGETDWNNNWIVLRGPNTTTPLPANPVTGKGILYGVAVLDNNGVFACGQSGVVLRITGDFGSITEYTSATTTTTGSLYGALANGKLGAGEVFFCGSDGHVLHFNHSTGVFINQKTAGGPSGGKIGAAIGNYSTSTGTIYYPAFYGMAGFEQLGGGGAKVVYIVGSTSVAPHYGTSFTTTIIKGVGVNGSYTWNRMNSGNISSSTVTLLSIWGRGQNDAYACGSSGKIFSINSNDQWNSMPSGSKYWHPSTASTWNYYGMTGNPLNNTQEVWVGGTKGRIMHHIPAGANGTLPNNPHMWDLESTPNIGANTIKDIHGNAWNNVWAVGTNGTVFKGYNKQGIPPSPAENKITWDPVIGLPATIQLNGVYTTGPGFVMACGQDGSGNGIVAFYNGKSWDITGTGRSFKLAGAVFTSISGLGPQAVWVCGNGGTIYKYDGLTWTLDGLDSLGVPVTTQDLTSIFAIQSASGYTKTVVAVGKGGEGVYYDSGYWYKGTTGTTEDLNNVHGSDTYSIYAVGNKGTILSFSTYGTWTKQTLPTAMQSVNFKSIQVNDIDDIWAVGDGGAMVRYEGYPVSAWQQQNSPAASTSNLTSIYAADGNEVFMADSTNRLYRGHSHWVVQVVRTLTIRNYLFALKVANGSYTDTWVVASDGSSARKDGQTQTWNRVETGIGTSLNCLFANDLSNPNPNVWAIGNSGQALKYNGTNWVSQTTNTASDLFWISGTKKTGGDPVTLVISGESQALLYSNNGGAWTPHTVAAGGSSSSWDWLTWVDVKNDTDMWVVGDRTAAYNTNPGTQTQWTFGKTGPGATQYFSPTSWLVLGWRDPDPTSNKIFMVGYSGQIAIYDGTAGGAGYWKLYYGTTGATASGTTSTLWSVWGKTQNDVWAVGSSGTIVRWNGTSWSSVTTPTSNTLYSIWGDSGSGYVYACGLNGTLLKYDYANPAKGWVREPITTDLDFFYVTGKGTSVIVTSEFGTVLSR